MNWRDWCLLTFILQAKKKNGKIYVLLPHSLTHFLFEWWNQFSINGKFISREEWTLSSCSGGWRNFYWIYFLNNFWATESTWKILSRFSHLLRNCEDEIETDRRCQSRKYPFKESSYTLKDGNIADEESTWKSLKMNLCLKVGWKVWFFLPSRWFLFLFFVP